VAARERLHLTAIGLLIPKSAVRSVPLPQIGQVFDSGSPTAPPYILAGDTSGWSRASPSPVAPRPVPVPEGVLWTFSTVVDLLRLPVTKTAIPDQQDDDPHDEQDPSPRR
jgi:hypothetical protein